ncbi:MAG: hypothetical protein K8S27_04140 [Candidatus Omnitrophica bacterium]|nr:hypothetical protein [Candidatus Omnitrophota bacterium]
MKTQNFFQRLFLPLTLPALVGCLSLWSLSARAEVTKGDYAYLVEHKKPRFSLLIPLELKPMEKETLSAYPGYIYGFIEGSEAAEDSFLENVSIAISPRGGVIGQETRDLMHQLIGHIKKSLPNDAEMDLWPVRVIDVDIHAIVSRYEIDKFPVVSFSVTMPLKEEAVEIVFFGPAYKELYIKDIMQKVFLSVVGESTYLNDTVQYANAIKFVLAVVIFILFLSFLSNVKRITS